LHSVLTVYTVGNLPSCRFLCFGTGEGSVVLIPAEILIVKDDGTEGSQVCEEELRVGRNLFQARSTLLVGYRALGFYGCKP